MSGLFGPSEQDLERLRSTVQSLGQTSVPGLAAALSWRERKAERLLAHELGRAGSMITYDPGRRLVRWAVPPLAAPPAPAETRAPPRAESARPPAAPAPVFTPAGLKTLCPSCRVPLQTTGSASLAVCPQCGRLSSARTAAAPTSRPPAAPPPPPVAEPPPVPRATPKSTEGSASLTDRRTQEMFAAWVTAKPIPCPKCRTPLRHRGVSEYTCPSCGQNVRFPSANAAPTPAAPPA